MNSQLVPYRPEHALIILERNVRECDLWLSKYPDWEKWTNEWGTGGPAYTLIINDEMVACGGVVLLGWNRGEAWTLFSTLLYHYKYTCFKTIKTMLIQIIKEYKLKRVQALIRPEFEQAKTYIERLGFKPEGRLASYGPLNEDMMIYGRIP